MIACNLANRRLAVLVSGSRLVLDSQANLIGVMFSVNHRATTLGEIFPKTVLQYF